MSESTVPVRMFYQTRAAQIAIQSLDRIREDEIIGMVVANPGVGKSQAIKYWRKRQGANFRHVWIEADVLTACRPILNALVQGLNLAPGGSMWDVKAKICAELAARPLTVIIDEADLLTVRTFELLRSIWDRVSELRDLDGERGFPLALFGAPKLRDMLSRDDLERLRRRTFHKAELPPLSRDEVAAVLKKWTLTYDDGGLDELTRLSRGSFGWLNAIVPIAQKLANRDGKVVTAKIMKATAKNLIGLPEE